MRRILSHALLVLLVPLMAGLFPQGAAANPPTYGFSFFFDSYDRAGCIETYFFLEAGTGADGLPFMDLDSLTMIDHCYTDPAQQFRVSVYARTNDFNVKTDGKLREATITATLPVIGCNGGLCDWVGSSLAVNLTLTATGELQGQPGTAISRQVVASGTITGRWGQNFTPNPATGNFGRVWGS